jgi:hypothetical protein
MYGEGEKIRQYDQEIAKLKRTLVQKGVVGQLKEKESHQSEELLQLRRQVEQRQSNDVRTQEQRSDAEKEARQSEEIMQLRRRVEQRQSNGVPQSGGEQAKRKPQLQTNSFRSLFEHQSISKTERSEEDEPEPGTDDSRTAAFERAQTLQIRKLRLQIATARGPQAPPGLARTPKGQSSPRESPRDSPRTPKGQMRDSPSTPRGQMQGSPIIKGQGSPSIPRGQMQGSPIIKGQGSPKSPYSEIRTPRSILQSHSSKNLLEERRSASVSKLSETELKKRMEDQYVADQKEQLKNLRAQLLSKAQHAEVAKLHELSALRATFVQNSEIKDRRQWLKSFPGCLVGKDTVSAMVKSGAARTRVSTHA